MLCTAHPDASQNPTASACGTVPVASPAFVLTPLQFVGSTLPVRSRQACGVRRDAAARVEQPDKGFVWVC